MARQNAAFIAFNRGLISPKALARVDLERTQLSAEVMTNWLPKTQGAMTIRPGTKYLGSSLNDTGAYYIEFVAATDETALLELTHQKMRVWIDDALLGRPKVDTTVVLSDTGWSNTSSGGGIITERVDLLPLMTGQTTQGVEITASSYDTGNNLLPWKAADDATNTRWRDTGSGGTALPSWWNADFGSAKSVHSYSIRAVTPPGELQNSPRVWNLLSSDYDTGTYATDTGKWTLSDTQGSETGWSVSQKRSYTLPDADTGTLAAKRHWRLHVRAVDGGTLLTIAEIELFPPDSASQVKLQSGRRIFNATSIGALAQLKKQVVVSDTGTEHSLAIHISRGPIRMRVGSTVDDDDYITEVALGTGYHNLAFVPLSQFFYITLQSADIVDRIVESLTIGDSGTVEITAPWEAANLDNIRHDQSADVTYVDCDGIKPSKIERRGTGRSWSVVEFKPDNGPFLSARSTEAKLSVSQKYGNTTMSSDIPFFTEDHDGTLMRLFNNGQSGIWPLGAIESATDAIELVGVSDTGDTGTPSQQSERRLDVSVSGTYVGTIIIERSFDGPDFGFHAASSSGGYIKGGDADDTGTFTRVVNDRDDNVTVWYRARMSAYTSGVALVTFTYKSLSVSGIARIIDFNSGTDVDVEVLSRFSDTGPTDVWQEGAWSNAQSFPSAVALHAGRLAHGARATLSLSVADDYENFDDQAEGDAAPILRTLGSGPVDNIYYLLSLLRLVLGTAGAEIALRSSSLDEPVTPENSNARAFSTQGSANLRALKIDNKGVYIQRSAQRLFSIGFAADTLDSDYAAEDLTTLVPDLLEAGVVSIAVQRQPDTRIHCVLADGRVGLLTFEPQEEILCWSMWEGDTGTGADVERAMVLPGVGEDAVYYHIRRTINGATKRYLERWALESECIGDTGLTWIMDCAKSLTDTGRVTTLTGFQHLAGESVVVWSDDTGSIAGVDRSPDVAGVQTRYTVGTGGATDTGSIVLTSGSAHHAVAGLPYNATWKSTKLAYAAEAGTALAQMKRTDKIGLILYRTHNNGIFFGNDTGKLDALPRTIDAGATVDSDKIFDTLDQVAMPFPGLWSSDSRIVLRGKSPRPVTVLAAIPTVSTNEKI